MSISFVWLYIFKCDVCMLNHMWIKPNRFLFFLFAFGSDLYHPCFSKFFQIVFMWKTCFLGVFVTHFMCKLNSELNGPNLKFFNFGQKISWLFRDYLMSKAYPWKISLVTSQVSFQRKFPDQLFKRHFVGHLF